MSPYKVRAALTGQDKIDNSRRRYAVMYIEKLTDIGGTPIVM